MQFFLFRLYISALLLTTVKTCLCQEVRYEDVSWKVQVKTKVALSHYFLTTFLQMVRSRWSAVKCIQGDWWEIRQSEKHSFPLIRLYMPDPRSYRCM